MKILDGRADDWVERSDVAVGLMSEVMCLEVVAGELDVIEFVRIRG